MCAKTRKCNLWNTNNYWSLFYVTLFYVTDGTNNTGARCDILYYHKTYHHNTSSCLKVGIFVFTDAHQFCKFKRESPGLMSMRLWNHDDVIKWKDFPRYWPFVRGKWPAPENSPHKGQWRRALMFSLISARINRRVNNREAGDLRRNRAHYDVILMMCSTKHQNARLWNVLKRSFILYWNGSLVRITR